MGGGGAPPLVQKELINNNNYIRPQQGFDKNIVYQLQNIVQTFSNIEKYCMILMDEMLYDINGRNVVWY